MPISPIQPDRIEKLFSLFLHAARSTPFAKYLRLQRVHSIVMSSLRWLIVPFAIATACFCVAQCSVFLPKQCPTDRPIVKDFDVKRVSSSPLISTYLT